MRVLLANVIITEEECFLQNGFLEYILPNTKISSDSWKAYNNIDALDGNYQHSTVNHKQNFVNPETSTQTQHLEKMWREVKRVKKIYKGNNRNDINAHLAKYQWRERNQVTLENAFEKEVQLILNTYFIDSFF